MVQWGDGGSRRGHRQCSGGKEIEVVGGRQGATGFDGARLRSLRHAAKLSQRELGDLIGADSPVIANYENGRAVPRVDRLRQLASALGVSPSELLPDEGPVNSLERLRIRAGLLQDEVAQRAGMTRTKYAAIERGQTATVGAVDAQTLATVLGVDMNAVLIAQAVARATFVNRASR
jgi:transcriptional regulator with XRE-family HTH domain